MVFGKSYVVFRLFWGLILLQSLAGFYTNSGTKWSYIAHEISSLTKGYDANKFISKNQKCTSLDALVQPFNPFTARRRNTKIRWFESDLESFYSFVEGQPLLTGEQELKYGKAMKMWKQIENLRKKLSLESGTNATITNSNIAKNLGCPEMAIEKMIKYGEISKLRLVNSNMKLVLAIVSRYRTSAIPNAELIAEGTRGLARAVLRYDYSKGFRFATYATWYVHQAISEYVRLKKHPAKMPSRYLLLLRKVKQYSTEYKSQYTRLPTVSEISEALSESQFDVNKVLTMQTYPVLLFSPLRSKEFHKQDGRDRTLDDVLPSKHKPPFANADGKDLRRNMEKMMHLNLNEVERDILRHRLGFDDGRAKAVKEVGKKFKISWKQVRSVERNAMSKLLSSVEVSDFANVYHSTV